MPNPSPQNPIHKTKYNWAETKMIWAATDIASGQQELSHKVVHDDKGVHLLHYYQNLESYILSKQIR